jgi:hypothetical protein
MQACFISNSDFKPVVNPEFRLMHSWLHVHLLLGNGLVKKFPRRQILGKQSVARLRNNSDNRRSVVNVVRAMPSARQQNCRRVYNIRCFICVVRAEGL